MTLNGAIVAFVAALTSLVAGSARAQDASAGEKVFKSQCSVCHAAAPGRNLVGPSLASVVGRKAGSIPGFHYTNANKSSGLTWDTATLDRYLDNPRGIVPGTAMTFAGLKSSDQRRDLIAYLATLH